MDASRPPNNPSVRRYNQIFWIFLGAFLLAACASPNSLISPTAPLPNAPTPSPFLLFTPTPPPANTPTPSPLPLFTAIPLPKNSSTPLPAFSPLCSPLKDYTFAELHEIESQPFEPNRPGKDDGHQGVDFAHWQYKDRTTLEGVEIQAVLPGQVAASIPGKYPYGNMIIIETPREVLSPDVLATYAVQPTQSLYLLYAHMQAPSPFQIGDMIACGQTIGNVGNTGASGNPHLHLETRVGPAGVTFVSMEYYKTTSTDEERANYESWRFLGDFQLFNPWELLQWGRDGG